MKRLSQNKFYVQQNNSTFTTISQGQADQEIISKFNTNVYTQFFINLFSSIQVHK